MHAEIGDLHHRENELSLIREAVAALNQGRPTLVAVHGPRGIGKSALLGAVPRLLPPRTLVLRARCHPSESQYAYGMVRQLFDGPNSAEVPAAPAGDTPGESLGEAPGSRQRPAHQELLTLLHTTRFLAADRPVAILVDDLPYADEPSLHWFASIARRLDDLPVLLAATLPATASERATAELGHLPYLRTLWPEPLCPTCTMDLVDRSFDTPVDRDLAALCHTLSRGNPLVLHELVEQLRREHVLPGAPDPAQVLPIGARALATTVLAWLEEDDPAAGELLRQLAVLGPDLDPAVSGALSQRGELHIQQARETLVRAGLLRAGTPARFPHAAVRPAALARVPAPDRRDLHGRAAAVLARLGAPARQTADHLLKAGSDWGLELLRGAGDQAAAAGDHEAAARYLRRALALLDSPDAAAGDTEPTEDFHGLTVRMAAVELHRDLDACARQTAAAAATAPGLARRAEALTRLASPALAATTEGTQPYVRTCGELAALAHPPREHLLRLATQVLLSGHRAGLRRAARMAAGGPPDAAARGFGGALAVAAAAAGRCAAARRAAAPAEAATGQQWEQLAAGGSSGLVGAVLALIWTGDLERARALANRLLEVARSGDDPATLLTARLLRGETHYRQGDFTAAHADAAAAARLARRLNASVLGSAALACSARALVGLGRAEEAAEELRQAPPAAEAHPFIKALTLHARGLVAAANGEHQAAVDLFLDCGHRLALRGITNPGCLPWRSAAAQSYLRLGEQAAAETIVGGGCPLPAPGTAVRRAARADRAGAAPAAGPAVTPAASAASAAPVAERTRLTPAELRVVELVVRGHSSLEVAGRLFLSKRTVDTHLGRIYRKLGIRSRHELIGALGTELMG